VLYLYIYCISDTFPKTLEEFGYQFNDGKFFFPIKSFSISLFIALEIVTLFGNINILNTGIEKLVNPCLQYVLTLLNI